MVTVMKERTEPLVMDELLLEYWLSVHEWSSYVSTYRLDALV